jgi:hypothetical protein
MMDFKQWLISEGRDDLYSWMSPRAEVFPVPAGMGHSSWAKQFLKKLISEMWEDGWLRIAFYGVDLYAHNEIVAPNEKQKFELINLAIENGMKRVINDNAEDNEIMWTSEDMM